MIRFTQRSLALMSIIALGAALPACSASSSAPAATIPANVGLEVHAVSGLKFDQTRYAAIAGETIVAYVNDDSIRHTLIVTQNDTKVSGFDLKVNQKGEIDAGSVTLAAGNYVLMCTVPGHQNMKADLTVK